MTSNRRSLNLQLKVRSLTNAQLGAVGENLHVRHMVVNLISRVFGFTCKTPIGTLSLFFEDWNVPDLTNIAKNANFGSRAPNGTTTEIWEDTSPKEIAPRGLIAMFIWGKWQLKFKPKPVGLWNRKWCNLNISQITSFQGTS